MLFYWQVALAHLVQQMTNDPKSECSNPAVPRTGLKCPEKNFRFRDGAVLHARDRPRVHVRVRFHDGGPDARATLCHLLAARLQGHFS